MTGTLQMIVDCRVLEGAVIFVYHFRMAFVDGDWVSFGTAWGKTGTRIGCTKRGCKHNAMGGLFSDLVKI